ncbi:MAG: hypothetical protein LBT26_07485 [Clostridiales Family XIII bacterium]|jgi:hypothetical protein|nr:hypothetical protein [Clostridiales Family XIII bacterium]
MADQIIQDRMKRKIGTLKEDSKGNITVYDARNSKIGVIKSDLKGTLTAYDHRNIKRGTYDPKTDTTKDASNKNIGKGNLLTAFYFPAL